jgi:hypothetical protein
MMRQESELGSELETETEIEELDDEAGVRTGK